jgi:glycosyltransferase involved in cell wall biosynthesis
MTEPTVCAIMLTKDRPELAKRAVECFRKQTYDARALLVWDTGALPLAYPERGDNKILDVFRPSAGLTIGSLRNGAIEYAMATRTRHPARHPFDILIHWDDDDWSHPNRIAEQVALLQASGADCVGYNEMLFWRTAIGPIESVERLSAEDPDSFSAYVKEHDGEAWLYTGTRGGVPALGTSLCYWRKTWERHHFANETQGVEDHWLREKNVVGVSVFGSPVVHNDPRMIARIHGGNTSNGYKLEEYVSKGSKEWQRVPQWDQRIRELLS